MRHSQGLIHYNPIARIHLQIPIPASARAFPTPEYVIEVDDDLPCIFGKYHKYERTA